MAKRFRTSQMHTAGADPALVVQGRIVNINLPNWTVDVAATFDRKRYFDIQVGSPYAHYSNGEGFFAMPDVGAQCMVTVPGDSSPPFVSTFVMPHELVDSSAADAPAGTRSHGNTSKNPTDATYAAGRPLPKPGDMGIKGRDGNFVTLHRGGVLAIGATELAQRMYIPLGNLVTDISGNYQHFNSGGAHSWTIQEGPGKTHVPSQHLETYRVFADNKYADIKIARGKVFSPMPEPDGGSRLAGAGVGQGDNNEIIYDVSVAPGGFDVTTGDTAPGASKVSVFRFVFDQHGNTLVRIEGKFFFHATGAVNLDLSDNMQINGKKNFSMTALSGIDVDGGSYTSIKGKAISIGEGRAPAARLGDVTASTVVNMMAWCTPVAPIPVTTPSGPGTIPPGVPFAVMLTIAMSPAGPGTAIGGSIAATGQSIIKV
jgi:hypothetical protein